MNIERIDFKLNNLKLPIIIIIGPPGAGKTVVGRHLAKLLNWDFYDTDLLIEDATAMKIPEIFSQHTEAVFRQLEKAVIKTISELCKISDHEPRSSGGTIISCGGGLPVPAENFDNLSRSGKIICLQASPATLMQRITQVKHRPLLNPNPSDVKTDIISNKDTQSRLEALIAERKDVYIKAEYQIDTTDQSIEEIVITIKTKLNL